MTLLPFIYTIHCESHVHCRLCRADSPAGQKFRDDQAAAFPDSTDYDCPLGLWVGGPVPESAPVLITSPCNCGG